MVSEENEYTVNLRLSAEGSNVEEIREEKIDIDRWNLFFEKTMEVEKKIEKKYFSNMSQDEAVAVRQRELEDMYGNAWSEEAVKILDASIGEMHAVFEKYAAKSNLTQRDPVQLKKEGINKKKDLVELDPDVDLLIRQGIEPNPGPRVITVVNGRGDLSMDITEFPHWGEYIGKYVAARLFAVEITIYGEGNQNNMIMILDDPVRQMTRGHGFAYPIKLEGIGNKPQNHHERDRDGRIPYMVQCLSREFEGQDKDKSVRVVHWSMTRWFDLYTFSVNDFNRHFNVTQIEDKWKVKRKYGEKEVTDSEFDPC